MKIKARPSKIEMTHQSMVDLASHLNRPEHYNDDLMVHDLDVLKQYPGKKFLWILRSNGTHLVPLQLGVDPAWVERAAEDKDNYCFVVDSYGGVISKITGEKAVHLINEMPLKAFPLQ